MTHPNKEITCNQGESLWDLLSEELITEIITRLPSKPLCRFKSVSKHHNSLISQPHLIRSYISRSNPRTWVILDRVPQLGPESTRFNLVDRPEISTFSVNPRRLAAEPITDTKLSACPSLILHSSNGLLLCGLKIRWDPHKDHLVDPILNVGDSFYVVNPVTCEWVPLPKPTIDPIYNRNMVAFATRVDPGTGLVDGFILAEYQPVDGSELAFLVCFNSDSGRWLNIPANYMLGNHRWQGDESFEFEGRLFWSDLSVGLITWEAVGMESKKKAVCRFIPLPDGRAKHSRASCMLSEHCVCVGGGCVQYIEVFEMRNCLFKFWRLEDCVSGEWSLKYKVSRIDVERLFIPCDFSRGMPIPCFVDPFEADVVYFDIGDHICSLNVRTCTVETCSSFIGHEYILPFVVPKWPSPLPKRLYAAYAKEEGNEHFMSKNFTEAIKCYSKSIDMSPNPVALANRAMAYLKVNKFHEAENDCSESLKLDSNYFKVYWRRAIARKEHGNLSGALEDVEVGLKLEPENKDVKKLYVELKTMLAKASYGAKENGEKGESCDMEVKGK